MEASKLMAMLLIQLSSKANNYNFLTKFGNPLRDKLITDPHCKTLIMLSLYIKIHIYKIATLKTITQNMCQRVELELLISQKQDQSKHMTRKKQEGMEIQAFQTMVMKERINFFTQVLNTGNQITPK